MHISSAQVGKAFGLIVGMALTLAVSTVPAQASEASTAGVTAAPVGLAGSGDPAIQEAVKYIQSHQVVNVETDTVSVQRSRRKPAAKRSARHVYILGGAEAFPM
ncbi:MAG: hypothetical protein SFV17_22460 [Candidatus Obscuribacter sp.]|nr:hypothetical protein [Candidatus Melainabacteria bacterium]MDX1989468.1 hypothetical protein [Candidatus Obscuribacter sp.]